MKWEFKNLDNIVKPHRKNYTRRSEIIEFLIRGDYE